MTKAWRKYVNFMQIFYNYIVAKIDSIVNDMEDASITLIDILVSHKK